MKIYCMKRFGRPAFILLMLACSGLVAHGQQVKPVSQKQFDPVTRWLQTSSIPIKTITAGNGFADLQPLRETLKDVRVVGLGEATHGTREHFQFKHRMVEFLVRELGYTVFGIEAQYFKCVPINEYLIRGSDTGDPDKLVNENLSGIYRTEEVADLVRWMHEYNKTLPPESKVKFMGFDVQTPHHAADHLRAYLKRTSPQYALSIEKVLAETAPAGFQKYWADYGKRTAAQKTRLRGKLFEMLGYLTAHESDYLRASTRAEYDLALQAARILVQSDQVRSTPDAKLGTDANKRDEYMAGTVEYLLNHERPNAKAILWAHNFHLWTYEPNSNAETTRSLIKHDLNFRPMGNYLKKAFGNAYYSFGFVLDRGSFRAVDDEAGDDATEASIFTIGPSPPYSYGWQFAQAGLGDLAVDLRQDVDKEVAAWLTIAHQMRYVGASFSKKWPEAEYSIPVVPRGNFDGLIFIEKTTAARALPEPQ